MEEKNYSKIEDIKSNLYNPKDKVLEHQLEGSLHKVNYKTQSDWKEEDKTDNNMQYKKKKSKTSLVKIFFIMAVILFIGAVGYSVYQFSSGGVIVSNDNIDINVLGNAFTKGGEELSLQIEILNRNNANLELTNLLVSYPSGAGDSSTDMTRLPKDTIGTIKPGESVIRSIKVKLFGEEKSIKNIEISLEYHPESSNAIFTKDKSYPITISSAPVSLFIDAPESSTSDQIFSLKVDAVLNSSLPDQNTTVLQMSYPNNFIFESAIPEPTFSNTTWNLSALTVKNPVSITIKGRLIGQDGDEQIFHAYTGITNPNNQSVIDIVYNSLLHAILIEKPFLEAKILVNNQDSPSYSASSGEEVSAQISWSNNLSTLINDAQIIVGLSGNVLDRNSINPGNGFYDSVNNQIIWDKNTISELGSVQPGASGNLSFKFKSISLLGNPNQIKDPQIGLSVSIKGRQPSLGSTFSDINNFSKKIIKIQSDFQIASSAGYSSGFLPPKAENETKYVVVWTISNTSNAMLNAQAKSVLPIYVNWVGSLTGGNENIAYNEITREVIWNIGSVVPNTGFSSSREASFMISLQPSVSQVGSIPQLMKEIALMGTDSFAGILIKNKYRAITTMLVNDPVFKDGYQRVVK